MELKASYPVVVTDKLTECRDFYTRCFGFRVVFEATWFVYLKPSDESPHGIAFIAPDHPSQPPGPETFDGEGILLTFRNIVGGHSPSYSSCRRIQSCQSSSPSSRPFGAWSRIG
jgi:catechol 2,3-dioxygenase-like lactoylglutathione lyase family enzyme